MPSEQVWNLKRRVAKQTFFFSTQRKRRPTTEASGLANGRMAPIASPSTEPAWGWPLCEGFPDCQALYMCMGKYFQLSWPMRKQQKPSLVREGVIGCPQQSLSPMEMRFLDGKWTAHGVRERSTWSTDYRLLSAVNQQYPVSTPVSHSRFPISCYVMLSPPSFPHGCRLTAVCVVYWLL